MSVPSYTCYPSLAERRGAGIGDVGIRPKLAEALNREACLPRIMPKTMLGKAVEEKKKVVLLQSLACLSLKHAGRHRRSR